jgi:hypothetical protein
VEQPEKDQVFVIDKGFDLAALEQDRMWGVTPDQAPVAPHGHEATPVAARRPRKPFRILAPFAAAIDERAREHIVILHPNSEVATERGPQFTGMAGMLLNHHRSS